MSKSIDLETSLIYGKHGKMALNAKDTAKEINISYQTMLKRLRENKNIPSYKRGEKTGAYSFPISEIAKYLQKNLIKINE